MNILNNIWIAISTPNEALVKFCCILFLFVEAPLSFYQSSRYYYSQTDVEI